MQIISGTTDWHIPEDTVASIGKFDGIHKGHEKIIKKMSEYRAKGLKLAVLTFDTPPNLLLSGTDKKVLTSNEEKRRIFEILNVDYLIEFPFNEKTAAISAEEFIEEFLIGRMRMKAMVVGTDCRFGHRGRGGIDTLTKYSGIYGYSVDVIDKLKYGNYEISSTVIRECIEKGDVALANEMLLYPFSFYGEVVHGRQLGRTIGMPTINLIPCDNKILPPYGVYYSRVEYDGRVLDSITNIGCKPTVSGDGQEREMVGVETYIYDFNEQIYGDILNVSLYEYVRAEQKFASFEALSVQLKQDILMGEKWHKSHK